MHHRIYWLAGFVFYLCAGLQPAAAQSKNLAPGFSHVSAQARVVLMPVDVELFSLSAGGVPEPRADWTEQAQKNLQQELQHQRANLAGQVGTLAPELADPLAELSTLHGAVAQTIFNHHIQGAAKLPTKNGELRWTLGSAVKELQAKSQADFALFVWIRDSYASPERKAAMLALALLGVGLTGGSQVGYASLVNLNDGQVVWFNGMMRASGDLREAKSAEETVQTLLKNFPRAP